MTEFGKRLKNLRKDRGLTQNELAKALKVSRSSIEMYEHGKREPDFETQEAIADFFNVNLDYLRGRSDRKTLTIHVVDAPEIVELYEKYKMLGLDAKVEVNNFIDYKVSQQTAAKALKHALPKRLKSHSSLGSVADLPKSKPARTKHIKNPLGGETGPATI